MPGIPPTEDQLGCQAKVGSSHQQTNQAARATGAQKPKGSGKREQQESEGNQTKTQDRIRSQSRHRRRLRKNFTSLPVGGQAVWLNGRSATGASQEVGPGSQTDKDRQPGGKERGQGAREPKGTKDE